VHGLFGHHHQRFLTRGFDISVAMPGPHAFAVRNRMPSSKAPSASITAHPALMTLANAPHSAGGMDVNIGSASVSVNKNFYS
jgi:hypothetical protein